MNEKIQLKGDENFQGYSISWSTQNEGQSVGCYVDVEQLNEDVFLLNMLVDPRFARQHFSNNLSKKDFHASVVELARRWVHGLIQLGRFEQGVTYEEARTTAWISQFGLNDFKEDDLRDNLLLALRRKHRAQIANDEFFDLDVSGFADVLGIRVDDVRGTLAELVLEGLAEGQNESFGGHSAENGWCTITGKGLTYLRQARASVSEDSPFVTVDDIDSFALVRKVTADTAKSFLNNKSVLDVEEDFVKQAICEIIGEPNLFKDWPGERSDVYTSRVEFRGRRVQTAMLLKGNKGAGDVLYPAGLGKRGDQDMRLFTEPALLMLVQFNGRIDSAVHQRLWTLAQNRGIKGDRPTVCVIDGLDTARLLRAYGHLDDAGQTIRPVGKVPDVT